MSDNTYPHGFQNFKALSSVTKRLISGPNSGAVEPWLQNEHGRDWSGDFLKEICKQFRVTISTKSAPKHLHFKIHGALLNVHAVEGLLERLDQHAGVIAKDNDLVGMKSIKAKHYEMLNVELRPLIEQTKAALNGELEKLKVSKMAQKQAGQHITETFAEAGAKAKTETKKTKGKSKNYSNFEPANISQAIGYTAIMGDDVDVTFLGGAAGGGKTYLAVAAGLKLIEMGKVSAIELYRPDQGAGNKMGALPGDKQDKEDIFLETVSATLHELTGRDLRGHLSDGTVKEAATPFSKRGATFRGTYVIVDEAQNLTTDQAKMLLTRIGEGAKVVITGDISSDQNDLRGKCPGLALLIAAQARSYNLGDQDLKKGMAFVEFTKADSIARHRLLPAIHKAFEDMPEEWRNALKDMEQVPQKVIDATKLFMDAAHDQMKQASVSTYNRFIAEAKQRFPAIFGDQPGGTVYHLAPAAGMGRNP